MPFAAGQHQFPLNAINRSCCAPNWWDEIFNPRAAKIKMDRAIVVT